MMRGRDKITSAFSSLYWALLAVGVFSFVINLLMLTGPLFMLQIYDRVLASGSVQTLAALAVIAIALYGFFGLLESLRSRVMFRVSRKMDEDLSTVTFLSDVRLPMLAGAKGDRMEPIRDLDRVRQFTASPGLTAFFDLLWMPLYVGLIFLFHLWLGYIAIVGALILFVLALCNEFTTRKPNQEMGGQALRRSAWSDTVRRNIEAVTALGMTSRVARKWDETNADYMVAANEAADRGGWFSASTKMVRFMLQSAVLGLGAYLAILQEITPGVMIAASIITSRAVAPVEQVVGHWQSFLSARQALGRLRQTLQTVPDAPDKTELPRPKETVTVEDLAVLPPGSRTPTLQGVRFDLKAGDGLGIIGPSASGKSSLARALVGVWPTVKGSVRLDGATLDSWESDRLGQAMGYLPQSVELLNGTIAEVISRFDPDPIAEEVIKAAQIAGVHEMILQLPQAYETPIGDNGAALSAGQRQRLGLARALYGTPFLVVLDEPNSNLDAEGEAALKAAIAAMREMGSIVIVIAHRPSALASVNKVLVLGNGRQQGFGLKEEVLKAMTVQRTAQKGGLAVVDG